jgi:DNA polymerase-3 subunit delta'
MEIIDLYLQSQAHKIISLDKARDMLSHAYMLECSDRFLLQHYALCMAQEIFCLDKNAPCQTCNNCSKVAHSNMVDLKIFPRDKSIVVDDINAIVDDAYQRPMDSDYKVYILNNFDEATTQAQNKILKTLEEPPHNVVFILTCVSSNAVLPTISSRVKTITDNLLDSKVASDYLKGTGIKNADSIIKVAGGNISTALKLSTGVDADKIIDLVFRTLTGLKTSADIIRFSSQITALKKDFLYYLDTMTMVLRDVAVSSNKSLINMLDRVQEIVALSQIYSPVAVEKIVTKLNEIYLKLEFNCNLNGVVDQMLLDILEVKFLCQK